MVNPQSLILAHTSIKSINHKMEMLSKRESRTSCNFGIVSLVVYKDNKMRPQESVVLSLLTTKKLTDFQHYLSQMYYHTVSSVKNRK